MMNMDREVLAQAAFAVFSALLGLIFLSTLRPVSAGQSQVLTVRPGEGFREVAKELAGEGLIRSRLAFEVYVLATGSFPRLQAGSYDISPASSTPAIAAQLFAGLDKEIEVVIPEGSSLYAIDKILAGAGVIRSGELTAYAAQHPDLEGRLFPDTYRFYADTSPAEAVRLLTANFEAKAAPLLGSGPAARERLILASLLEKEVPGLADQKLVAGILRKRLRSGMPLQVDASICYLKQVEAGGYVPCVPLAARDFRNDSPYNAYLYKGLPPGPIGNPGLQAIQAVLAPSESPYWYYLSDPVSKKTVFARTFDEHNANRVRYLGIR